MLDLGQANTIHKLAWPERKKLQAASFKQQAA